MTSSIFRAGIWPKGISVRNVFVKQHRFTLPVETHKKQVKIFRTVNLKRVVYYNDITPIFVFRHISKAVTIDSVSYPILYV